MHYLEELYGVKIETVTDENGERHLIIHHKDGDTTCDDGDVDLREILKEIIEKS